MLARIWRTAPVVIIEVSRKLLPGKGDKTLLEGDEPLAYGLDSEFGGEAFQRHRNQVLPRGHGHPVSVLNDRSPRRGAGRRGRGGGGAAAAGGRRGRRGGGGRDV